MCSLTQKYNVAGPRYTSYPTVPYWNEESFSSKQWRFSVSKSYDESQEDGISLYIHLPFCESMCTFCGCHKRITKRHDLEKPYIRSVLKEWSLYLQLLGTRPLIREIHLGGGTPTFFSMENLRLLIEGLLRRSRLAPGASLGFEGHPNNTTREHLQGLYDLGFRKVCFGVQDYNEQVQTAINRYQSFEQVRDVTQLAREIGYTSVGHDIIYGLPFQTLEHVKNTIARTQEIRPDRIAFYSYAHVPWRKGNGQRGYKEANLPSAEDKRQQYEQGKALLTQLGYREIGMDHFALETDSLYKALETGTLHRNFMGYTPERTQLMIGLGVSSISDSGYAFAQNVKSVEEYQHLVACDILPVYRGHILTEEDRILRQQILNLMCQFRTSWTPQEAMQIDFESIVENLAELRADDLLEMSDNSLVVTEAGKPFIRNISMAFDLRLQRKQPETQLFSMTV